MGSVFTPCKLPLLPHSHTLQLGHIWNVVSTGSTELPIGSLAVWTMCRMAPVNSSDHISCFVVHHWDIPMSHVLHKIHTHDKIHANYCNQLVSAVPQSGEVFHTTAAFKWIYSLMQPNWLLSRWEFMFKCSASDYCLAKYGENCTSCFTNTLMGWWWQTRVSESHGCSPTARGKESWCRRGCYLSLLMPISLRRDVGWWRCDGHVFFPTSAISLCVMATLFYDVIALIWKAIALDSKSNQVRSHSDENELIRKAVCLHKGKRINTERGHHTQLAAFKCQTYHCRLQTFHTHR